jgi:hypothetical protein
MARDERDPSVCTVPLETEDGQQVVICQENVGPGNQVGRGEFKSARKGKTPGEAAAEQAELQRRSPTA